MMEQNNKQEWVKLGLAVALAVAGVALMVLGFYAVPIDEELLTLTGGEFTTIANHVKAEASNFHNRNISILRSNVEVSGITHLISGEGDVGSPYYGFLYLNCCADVKIHHCVFTAHRIYNIIGSAGRTVPIGSYDIVCMSSANVAITHCKQTTDITDDRYWGLIATNFCRDMVLEDCYISRFDAHMGITNCTLRRCTFGWQCMSVIGNGTLLVEETEVYAVHSFLELRRDYGSNWRGDIIIRNCTWYLLTENRYFPKQEERTVVWVENGGKHYFGYDCYLTESVEIDGLTVKEDSVTNVPLSIFKSYVPPYDTEDGERKYRPILPRSVKVKNIITERDVQLCERPELMVGTKFVLE